MTTGQCHCACGAPSTAKSTGFELGTDATSVGAVPVGVEVARDAGFGVEPVAGFEVELVEPDADVEGPGADALRNRFGTILRSI